MSGDELVSHAENIEKSGNVSNYHDLMLDVDVRWQGQKQRCDSQLNKEGANKSLINPAISDAQIEELTKMRLVGWLVW